MEIVFIIFFFIVALLSLYIKLVDKKHQKKLNLIRNSRPEISREEYINILIKLGYRITDSELIYDLIKVDYAPKNFSIYPEDDLFKIYNIDSLDDIDIIDNVCNKLNLRKATQDDIDEIEKKDKIFNTIFILNLINHIRKI